MRMRRYLHRWVEKTADAVTGTISVAEKAVSPIAEGAFGQFAGQLLTNPFSDPHFTSAVMKLIPALVGGTLLYQTLSFINRLKEIKSLEKIEDVYERMVKDWKNLSTPVYVHDDEDHDDESRNEESSQKLEEEYKKLLKEFNKKSADAAMTKLAAMRCDQYEKLIENRIKGTVEDISMQKQATSTGFASAFPLGDILATIWKHPLFGIPAILGLGTASVAITKKLLDRLVFEKAIKETKKDYVRKAKSKFERELKELAKKNDEFVEDYINSLSKDNEKEPFMVAKEAGIFSQSWDWMKDKMYNIVKILADYYFWIPAIVFGTGFAVESLKSLVKEKDNIAQIIKDKERKKKKLNLKAVIESQLDPATLTEIEEPEIAVVK
jgi:hypothetical protein